MHCALCFTRPRLHRRTRSGSRIPAHMRAYIGQRVRKTAPASGGAGVTRHFMYDEAGRLVGEYDATGKLIQETVWFNDLPIATLQPAGTFNQVPVSSNPGRTCVVAPQNAVDIYYIHADHLGTPRVITRPSDDKVLWQWDNVEAFGNSAPNENPNGVGAFSFNLRFPGQYYDQETGTHYNYFRDYDPAIGRYRQSDPIGLKGGASTYAYVRARPLMRIDVYGLCDDCASRSAGLGGGPVRPPDLTYNLGLGVAGMFSVLGYAGEAGLAYSERNRKMCFYTQNCGILGIGAYAGAGLNVGVQTGSVDSGTQKQNGFCVMGGAGPAADLQFLVGEDGSISGAKGAAGIGKGLGLGINMRCETTYRCITVPRMQ
jgi:RHS repeat-associated protein